MAIILAIEAASDFCSIALDDGTDCFQEVLPAARSHSKLLYPMLNRLLKEAGYSPKQLDAIAFAKGPGSFTGLRIAAATAQGIGFANDIPLLPVSTLQAMAQQVHSSTNAETSITLMDARMNEFYGGEYALKDGLMSPLMDDFIASLKTTPEQLNMQPADRLCCAQDLLSELDPAWSNIALEAQHLNLEAKYLLPKAKAMFANHEGCQPEDIELVYLREQDHWKTIKQQKELKQ
ncbi:tRNA (adenosine(37)-N6)-threonylcarbamoyltransferase complex dimerization subunit type 1 TsaB [Bermanella marisrubri]|uniref:tRNA threonylcarbamoyladenosine biosynthesis protein TsaB n=1 Tax=Bermanella marisrubri TaxID=207949 RepID=Q1MXN6_9GAMM|nr:tRNA (adenosine(37)-N6)-threonylcarbamoyltransferase complex dimerization subunit type 1 TsaB [Bermanella marisrubri]EAT10748.1 hypothetical protein RED65_03875 [Oceanobacter sp. RED65] [Bermanella marisrubri]QIZ83609.1 tRNA (adenosine(37)-N6)-threonylcarbamoyltransferase complex dimerization subunit type 1 TsaB [Bermanella marisrubri]